MTISPNVGSEFNIAQIIELAYRMSGLLNEHQSLSDVRARIGRQFLDLVLKALQGPHVPAKAESFYTVQLIAGTYKYVLPDNVLEVMGTPVGIPEGNADPEKPQGEWTLERISQETWQTTLAKDASGPPTHLYTHRANSALEAWFWPVPDDASTVRLRVQRLLADVSAGSDTVELERPWSKYLVYAVAHQLCMSNSQPLAKVANFERMAEQELAECMGFAEEHVDGQFTVYHPTGYER